jgi:L-lysine 2,3-aminomutase
MIMEQTDPRYDVTFSNSGDTRTVSLDEIENVIIDFLENFTAENLLGPLFFDQISRGPAPSSYDNLLHATGFAGDSHGFLREMLSQIEQADSTAVNPVTINGIPFPAMVLLPILEQLLPGTNCITVHHADQIETIANQIIPKSDTDAINRVIDTYPVRFSMHTIRQMRISRNVACQYLPFKEELNPVGHTNTWIGQFHQGFLEQMYKNRVIFLLNMSCPVYCRFCFRKHKDSRNEKNPGVNDVMAAVDHVRKSPSIKEIVITGGDPFLNPSNMEHAIDGLKTIDHVQTLRLATRSVAYYPDLFLKENARWLNYLKTKNLELMQTGKRIEIATHFIHPDEVSVQSLSIISELVKGGIAVYVQTPFLENCNDKGPELARLFQMLRGAGAELHYIYIPCSPIHGNSVYWSPLSKGIEAGRYLRAHVSDRSIPRICTATPIGKMDWNTSGWVVEKDRDNPDFLWIRTPYTPGYFNRFAPVANDLGMIRVNEEGTMDVRYMATLGDDALILGSRPARSERRKANEFNPERYEAAKASLKTQADLGRSLVSLDSATLARVHKTRVELETDYTDADILYIRANREITDVVLVSKGKDPGKSAARIKQLVHGLKEIQHVNCLRIRSLDLIHDPATFTHGLIETLGSLNTLSVANPLRIDVETWVICAKELTPRQQEITQALYRKGITTYFNVPLITQVNDNGSEIQAIAHKSRSYGMQFHHIYVAGLALQESLNSDIKVDMDHVVDIATRVRRDGSGREIPAYIIQTDTGEIDFEYKGMLGTPIKL